MGHRDSSSRDQHIRGLDLHRRTQEENRRGLLPVLVLLQGGYRYQRTLFHYRQASGKPLSFSAQHSRLVAVRVFFKWLMRRQVIVANPASELELPRVPHQLPRHVLSVHEVEAVLRQPDVADVLGLRDRCMMELLYSTGIRRSELVHLKVFDLDFHRGTLFIKEGKGQRDRVVPVGERALAWVQKYLDDSRPHLVAALDDGILFLTNSGDAMTLARATDIVGGHVDSAKLGKRGACHQFRHACATALLEGGADIRYIQAMLGHADVSTTQIYASVSIHALKAVHARCHPGASLNPKANTDGSIPGIPIAGHGYWTMSFVVLFWSLVGAWSAHRWTRLRMKTPTS